MNCRAFWAVSLGKNWAPQMAGIILITAGRLYNRGCTNLIRKEERNYARNYPLYRPSRPIA